MAGKGKGTKSATPAQTKKVETAQPGGKFAGKKGGGGKDKC